MIAKQRWKEPIYSKKEINEAGDILRRGIYTDAERDNALEIIDNWRAAHAYPLHVFYMNLRRHASTRTDVLVVERLKRLDSIVKKIEREKGMQLYRMQDLGGCRVVLPTIQDVYDFEEGIIASRIRHELKKRNDYITKPKTSGYRSLHLIYRFISDTPSKQVFNEYPMLIEIQIRTHMQHIWATAVETLGFFINQAIKSGQGTDDIKRFFALVSSLFAIEEKCSLVPGTSDKQANLIDELKRIDRKNHVLEKLRAIRVALFQETENKQGYYILRLYYNSHRVSIRYFLPSEYEAANNAYDKYEQEYHNEPADTVLVRATSFETVKNAYPNYFMDIAEFIAIIDEYFKS